MLPPNTNLLYRYGELVDACLFADAADLSRHARIKLAGHEELQDDRALLSTWQHMVRLYQNGKPNTRHVITNPLVEVDGHSASCHSCYTMLQATEDFPLQLIAAGRYDWFERIEGRWRFSCRDYILPDLQGDLSRHLDLAALSKFSLKVQWPLAHSTTNMQKPVDERTVKVDISTAGSASC